jgi:hypothetical protein
MSDDPLDGDAIGYLDEQLADARVSLSRTVDRVDALRELQQMGTELQAELRRPPTLHDLLGGWATEVDRARVRALLGRSTSQGETE